MNNKNRSIPINYIVFNENKCFFWYLWDSFVLSILSIQFPHPSPLFKPTGEHKKEINYFAFSPICTTFAAMKAKFMIAAPMSGSGKTTIARGLMAMLNQKGYKVQPFKCGPDYIDTKFHEMVCGRPSINLDTFMATPEHVRELFAHYGADADICVVEGMMGLYDGYDRDRGSSYEIARVLNIPVVLVVDAKSAAYSMAALLQGFMNFTPPFSQSYGQLPSGKGVIAGIIFNKVGSEKHFRMLKQVCEDLNITCFGYLPKDVSLEQGSRYLGLDFSQQPEIWSLINTLEQHVDWNSLLRLSAFDEESYCIHVGSHPLATKRQSALIARNAESFSFLYQETIDRFEKVDFFDPETDVPDFTDVDLLYLPGGYPEKHLDALVHNEACRMAVKDFAEGGGRVVAECGGMMYLCRAIVADSSHPISANAPTRSLSHLSPLASHLSEYPMCGILPYTITARKADRKLSLGYRRFELDGKEYRGHEFHYTQFYRGEEQEVRGERMAQDTGIINPVQQSAAQVYNGKGEPVDTPVFRYKNVLASYTHLYQI